MAQQNPTQIPNAQPQLKTAVVNPGQNDRAQAFNRAVGQWLRKSRKKSRMTVAQAARHLNLSKQEMKDIESGQASIAGADFYALLEAYELPPESVNSFLEDFGLKADAE